MAGKSRYELEGFVCAGFMCGSSLDGLDGALIRVFKRSISLLAFAHFPFESTLSGAIREALSGNIPRESVADFPGMIENLIGQSETALFRVLLEKAQIFPEAVDLIGTHGITASHHPGADQHFGGVRLAGHTTQFANPHLACESFGIPVVSDFRRTDVASGGEGAPLAPIFHRAAFSHRTLNRAFLNVGGIANLTSLPAFGSPGARMIAFDTGPGNMLTDAGARWATNGLKECDENGDMARKGHAVRFIVDRVLSDPWFHLPPPKSTGREDWGEDRFLDIRNRMPSGSSKEDLLATLTEITARSVSRALLLTSPPPDELIVGGGGVRNQTLMKLLTQFTERPVYPSDQLGIPAQAVESMAFAYLGLLTMTHRSGTLPELTGGRAGRVLGTITIPGSRPLAAILPGMLRGGDTHLPFPDRARANGSHPPG